MIYDWKELSKSESSTIDLSARPGAQAERKVYNRGHGVIFRTMGLLAAMMIFFAACGEEENPSGSSRENGVIEPQNAVVQVKAGDALGSAVLVGSSKDESRLVLWTANHVLEELAEGDFPVVVFEDGNERKCDGFERAETMDAAVLYINDAALVEKLLLEDKMAWQDKDRLDRLRDGDDCIAIGGADGGEKSVCTGEILDNWIYMEDYRQYMIWAEAAIHPGMSGGGLFDSEGCLVGILSGGSEDGQLAAVPVSLILSEFHNSTD